MRKRHAVSNEQWIQIEKLLPQEVGRVARPAKSNRKMLDAMVWILQTGAPWRDLPWHFGPWQSVYTRLRRWSQQGIWHKVLEVLAAERDDETYIIDATGAEKKAGRRRSGILEEDQRRRFMLSWKPSVLQ